MASAAIGLGGNIASPAGDPAATIAAALRDLSVDFQLAGISRFYRSAAFPAGSGPDFINAAAIVNTTRSAADLLASLHRIEAKYARERRQRWGARTLDLDLLLMGDAIIPDRQTHDHWVKLLPQRQMSDTPESLVLPHPRLQDRGFVLIPLAEIAPHWCHPVTGLSVAEMCARLPEADKDGIMPI